MLRIKPISEGNASAGSGQLHQVYEDIKSTLQAPSVPLVFQYIANFEEYLVYLWGKIKTNIQSPYFTSATEELVAFTNQEISQIYSPSSRMSQFVNRLQPEEKEHIQKTITELQALNAKLLIITIALREGVKGVIIGQDQLLQLDTKQYEVDIFDIFHTSYQADEKELEPATRMLAPLFGSSAIAASQYPAFFSGVAQEMENLLKEEDYLSKRVGLERLAMSKALGLPFSIGCSYQEIMAYAGHKPHLNELIYILAETFPSQFPRLLITTIIMQLGLANKHPLSVAK